MADPIEYHTLVERLKQPQERILPTGRVQLLANGNYLFWNVPDYDNERKLVFHPWVEITGTVIFGGNDTRGYRTQDQYIEYFRDPRDEHRGMSLPSMSLLCSLISVAHIEYRSFSHRALLYHKSPIEQTVQRKLLKSDAQLFLEDLRSFPGSQIFTSTNITYDTDSLDAVIRNKESEPIMVTAPEEINRSEGLYCLELAPEQPETMLGEDIDDSYYKNPDHMVSRLYEVLLGPMYPLPLVPALQHTALRTRVYQTYGQPKVEPQLRSVSLLLPGKNRSIASTGMGGVGFSGSSLDASGGTIRMPARGVRIGQGSMTK